MSAMRKKIKQGKDYMERMYRERALAMVRGWSWKASGIRWYLNRDLKEVSETCISRKA